MDSEDRVRGLGLGTEWCQSCESPFLDIHTEGCSARHTGIHDKPSAGGILKDVKPSRFEGAREPMKYFHATGEWIVSSEDAIKPIEGKVRFELIPVRSLETVARVLTHGAAIRGDNNWQKGQSWSRYIGAALRHIYAFMRGEDNDIETSEPHLAHAVCCCLFLLEYMHTHRAKDDRGKIL